MGFELGHTHQCSENTQDMRVKEGSHIRQWRYNRGMSEPHDSKLLSLKGATPSWDSVVQSDMGKVSGLAKASGGRCSTRGLAA